MIGLDGKPSACRQPGFCRHCFRVPDLGPSNLQSSTVPRAHRVERLLQLSPAHPCSVHRPDLHLRNSAKRLDSGVRAAPASVLSSADPFVPPLRVQGEFSPELQAKLDHLKVESDKGQSHVVSSMLQGKIASLTCSFAPAEPWIVKNKFPPHLKDELVQVAYFALEIGEYDDEFYAVMPKIFPYNLFTMKKLIKREVYAKRMADLAEELDQQLEILREGIRRNWAPQREEFERKLADYERKLAQGDGTTASGSTIAAARATPEPPAGPLFGNSPAISTPLIATVDGMNGSPAPGKEDAEDKTGEPFSRVYIRSLFGDPS